MFLCANECWAVAVGCSVGCLTRGQMSGLVLCTVNQPAISGTCGELWLTGFPEKVACNWTLCPRKWIFLFMQEHCTPPPKKKKTEIKKRHPWRNTSCQVCSLFIWSQSFLPLKAASCAKFFRCPLEFSYSAASPFPPKSQGHFFFLFSGSDSRFKNHFTILPAAGSDLQKKIKKSLFGSFPDRVWKSFLLTLWLPGGQRGAWSVLSLL